MTPKQSLRRATGAAVIAALPDGTRGQTEPATVRTTKWIDSHDRCGQCGCKIRYGVSGRRCKPCRIKQPVWRD